MTSAESEASRAVRQADPDRFLSALYAPADHRGALFSLYAFYLELGAVRDRIRGPMTGEIRLQWWRDVLADPNNPAPAGGNPVAVALQETIRRYQLPVQPFRDMIEARVFDLYDDPMPTRNDLEGYCGETSGALIQLCSLVLNSEAASETGALAGHAGCAQKIAGLLHKLPVHRRRGQCYIPLDLLASVGVSRDEFVLGEDREGVRRATLAMAALGKEHFTAFREHAGSLPADLRPAYLPLAVTGAYLNRVESGALDPLEESSDLSPWRRHLLLLKHAVFGWRK